MGNNQKLSIYIKKLNIAFENKCNKELKPYNIPLTQFKILKYLLNNRDREINQKDLEKHFSSTNPTITGVLNRLEAKKFIKRVISENDARFRKIELCEKAILLNDEFIKVADTFENDLTKGFSEEEKKVALVLFQKMLDNLYGY